MATWKCDLCGWYNADPWSRCAKCGEERLTEGDLQLLDRIRVDLGRVLLEIEEDRSSNVPKWEYLILEAWLDTDHTWKILYRNETYHYGQLHTILDELGNQGWELMGVTASTGSEKPFTTHFTFTYTAGEQFYLKRSRAPVPGTLQQQLDLLVEPLPPRLRRRLQLAE